MMKPFSSRAHPLAPFRLVTVYYRLLVVGNTVPPSSKALLSSSSYCDHHRHPVDLTSS